MLYKRESLLLHNMLKMYTDFVYVLHRVDKRGEANKIYKNMCKEYSGM
jgi:hypothetical protein